MDRYKDHRRNLYDSKFNILETELLYKKGKNIKKPKNFEQAVNIAQKLSEDFNFIRVDLYIFDDFVYFGELTNSPGNGFEPFNPKSFDFKLGKKFNIKAKVL